MALIINDEPGAITNYKVTNDDGRGNEVKIPVAMISFNDGKALINYIVNHPKENIYLSVEIGLNKRNKVKIDLFTNILDNAKLIQFLLEETKNLISKNKSDLNSYYKVGKLIVEAQGGEARAKYGDNLIKEYSIKLTKELRKNYNITTLKRIRQFYIMIKKGAAMRHQLSWTHYRELLSLKNINEINYYIDVTIKQNLSYRKLKEKIQNTVLIQTII